MIYWLNQECRNKCESSDLVKVEQFQWLWRQVYLPWSRDVLQLESICNNVWTFPQNGQRSLTCFPQRLRLSKEGKVFKPPLEANFRTLEKYPKVTSPSCTALLFQNQYDKITLHNITPNLLSLQKSFTLAWIPAWIFPVSSDFDLRTDGPTGWTGSSISSENQLLNESSRLKQRLNQVME